MTDQVLSPFLELHVLLPGPVSDSAKTWNWSLLLAKSRASTVRRLTPVSESLPLHLKYLTCYIGEMRQKNANITVMIQADMLAYHAPGEPPQIGLPM